MHVRGQDVTNFDGISGADHECFLEVGVLHDLQISAQLLEGASQPAKFCFRGVGGEDAGEDGKKIKIAVLR